MKLVNPTHGRLRASRAGFTLVELLVVMTIIAVLAALTVGASMRIITVQDEANTKTLVKKVHSVLEKHWKAVIDKANKEPIPSFVVDAAGGDAQRARVIYVKLRLKQEFPMSYAEALNPTPLPGLPTYVQKLTGVSSTSGWNENSGCLLLALSQARAGIQFNADDLGPGATISLDNNGVKQIVDSWGKPVVFFRWPTGNPEVDALNPASSGIQTTFRDPEDPNGLLLNPAWWANATLRNQFQSWCHSITDRNNANNSYAYYLTPVVASGGPDKNLGIRDAAMTSDGTPANSDNIYSYNLR